MVMLSQTVNGPSPDKNMNLIPDQLSSLADHSPALTSDPSASLEPQRVLFLWISLIYIPFISEQVWSLLVGHS